MRKCLNCGKELVGKQEKYCSAKCNGSWHRTNNKEKVKESKRKCYEKNRESILYHAKNKYQKNKEKMREQSKLSYQKNKKKKKEYRKRYYQENKEKRRQTVAKYYQRNKENIKKYSYQYHQDNKIKRKKYYQDNKDRRRKYLNDRYKNDIIFRLNLNLSSSIRQSLKSNNLSKGGRHWEDLVGYTVYEFKKHIEGMFKPGMTWGNHGINGWHIDHIVPKHFFKYKDVRDVEFKYCWSLENLQPLWAKDNMSKNGKIPWESFDK